MINKFKSLPIIVSLITISLLILFYFSIRSVDKISLSEGLNSTSSMEIYDVKINDLSSPIGYDLSYPTFSWKVKNSKGSFADTVRVDIFKSIDLDTPILSKEVSGNSNKISIDNSEFQNKLEPRTEYTYYISVLDDQGDLKTSLPQTFETGKLNEEWEAQWITVDQDLIETPVFIRDFNINKSQIAKARLYITGLGLYKAFINEADISNEVLTPYYSDYSDHIEYQTFNITDLIQDNNTLKIYLGDGWYKGRFGMEKTQELYQNSYNLLCEIHIDYINGKTEVINSDDEFYISNSFILSNDIYDGEVQDLRLLDNEVLAKAKISDLNRSEIEVIERTSIPVIEKEEMYPVEIITTPEGDTVLDYGQNLAGYIEVTHELTQGQELTLDYAEILQNGNFFDDNYRSAESIFKIVSNGTRQTSKPFFTYYGFRYVKLSGIVEPINPSDYIAKVVYSDLEITGDINTGNSKVNQLFSNIMWSQKSNFINIPTDCPQRDERLGWTGDALIFAPTASYNMDTQSFFINYLDELRVEQEKMSGGVPTLLPDDYAEDNEIASGWSDIATFLPITLYEQYGDINLLKRYYPLMKDWVLYLKEKDESYGQNYLWDFDFQYGDWLAQDGRTDQSSLGGTDETFIATCYWAESTKKAAQAAQVLGETKDNKEFEELYENIKSAIFSNYYTESGKLAVDTQTAYLLALDFDLYPNRDQLINDLRNRLYKDMYKITGGFLGATNMLRILSENGLEEEALYFLLNEEYPGWLYEINLGATTIWERWNSLLPDGTVSGTTMNSFNHYAYGSVGQYLYENIAGIQKTEIGFKKVHFKPYITSEIGFCDLTYDSEYGEYIFNWELLENSDVRIHLEVPFGCKAELDLPYNEEKKEYTMGVYDFTYTPSQKINKIFTRNTLLKKYISDEGYLETIRSISPNLYLMLVHNNEEILNESLDTLSRNSILKYNNEEIDQLEAAIKNYFKQKY